MNFLSHLVFEQSFGMSSGCLHLVPLQHVYGADGAPYNIKGMSSVGAVGSCSMVDITCWCQTNVVMKVEKGRKRFSATHFTFVCVFCW